MAKASPVKADFDLDTESDAIAARFDALKWDDFTAFDKQRQNALKDEIFVIRRDLMKLGAHDMRAAARIWDEHVPTFVPRPLDFSEPEPYAITVNSIERSWRKRRPSTEPWLEEPVVDGGQESPKDASKPEASAPAPEGESIDPKAVRHRLLLEGLDKQYLKAEDKYHFRDRSGELAFAAEGKKLTTSHETPAVVGSMIDLAETRGWETLKLYGTEAFRREAWLQASLRGLDVTGFRPNKLDKVRLEEMRSEFAAGRGRRNTMADGEGVPAEKLHAGFSPAETSAKSEAKPALSKDQDAVLSALEKTMRARGDSDTVIAAAKDAAAEKLGKGRLHVGRLAETGTVPYQDKPGEIQSHYVVLEDDVGRRQKIWGVDLPRALGEGQVKTGDHIALAFRGQRPVTVSVKVPNEDGKGDRLEKREVERNAWEAVKLDRLRDSVRDRIGRQSASPVRSTQLSNDTRGGSSERRQPPRERYR